MINRCFALAILRRIIIGFDSKEPPGKHWPIFIRPIVQSLSRSMIPPGQWGFMRPASTHRLTLLHHSTQSTARAEPVLPHSSAIHTNSLLFPAALLSNSPPLPSSAGTNTRALLRSSSYLLDSVWPLTSIDSFSSRPVFAWGLPYRLSNPPWSRLRPHPGTQNGKYEAIPWRHLLRWPGAR